MDDAKEAASKTAFNLRALPQAPIARIFLELDGKSIAGQAGPLCILEGSFHLFAVNWLFISVRCKLVSHPNAWLNNVYPSLLGTPVPLLVSRQLGLIARMQARTSF